MIAKVIKMKQKELISMKTVRLIFLNLIIK